MQEPTETLLDLEKSIFTQNKLINEQLSRFFEYTKTNIYKSLENVGRTSKSLKNEVKLNYNYSYIPLSERISKMNLSKTRVQNLRKISKENISLALDRDSMKNIKRLSKQNSNKFPKKEKDNFSNLFKTPEKTPKIYSRKNVKISNKVQLKKQNLSPSKMVVNNLSESMKGITEIDFGTLGKEGKIVWVNEKLTNKPKFQYLGKIFTSSNKKNAFRNVTISKNQVKQGVKQNIKKVDAEISKNKKLNYSKKNSHRVFPDRRKGLGLDTFSQNRIKNTFLQEYKNIQLINSPSMANSQKQKNYRSRSAFLNKNANKKNKKYNVQESKYSIMRDLDKKIKKSRNQSLISAGGDSKISRTDTEYVLKEKQLKMREIRRNYMQKWKEKEGVKKPVRSYSRPKKAKNPVNIKSTKNIIKTQVSHIKKTKDNK